MSSFFAGVETINATLMLVLKAQGPRSLEGLNELGRSLWMINALAMEQRYADENARGVSETLCMRLSPCGFDGSLAEPFWV